MNVEIDGWYEVAQPRRNHFFERGANESICRAWTARDIRGPADRFMTNCRRCEHLASRVATNEVVAA